jgi:hypothetical protein
MATDTTLTTDANGKAVCCPPEQSEACNACLTTDTAPNAPTAILAARDEAIADPFADTIDPADHPSPDDLAEFHEWTAEQIAREHFNCSHVPGLVELVSHQSAFYRAWPTAAGAMIADALDALAAKTARINASTPEEFFAREQSIEDKAREQWWEVGFQEGLTQAHRECERRHGSAPGASFGGHPSWED